MELTKEKYLEIRSKMKNDLKELGKKLKEIKADFKSFQKEKAPIIYNYWGKVTNHETNKVHSELFEKQSNLLLKKSIYRDKHIVYSILKGRTYKEVENKTRKEKKLSFNELLSELYYYNIPEEIIKKGFYND